MTYFRMPLTSETIDFNEPVVSVVWSKTRPTLILFDASKAGRSKRYNLSTDVSSYDYELITVTETKPRTNRIIAKAAMYGYAANRAHHGGWGTAAIIMYLASRLDEETTRVITTKEITVQFNDGSILISSMSVAAWKRFDDIFNAFNFDAFNRMCEENLDGAEKLIQNIRDSFASLSGPAKDDAKETLRKFRSLQENIRTRYKECRAVAIHFGLVKRTDDELAEFAEVEKRKQAEKEKVDRIERALTGLANRLANSVKGIVLGIISVLGKARSK